MTLQLDNNQALAIPVDHLLGECVAVLGIRGSGKSNTAAVLAEELLNAGLPLCIVDIAGEYWGLKERYQVLVAGQSPHVDVEITIDSGPALAEFSLQNGVPVVLDLSGFRKAERFTLLAGFFNRLWDLAGELRRPYQVVLEEAHNFIPQAGSTPVNELLVQIAAEGRKRGLGIIMVGQRSSRLDKNVLTQAGILLLHRVRHPSDVSVYQDLVPKERAWVKSTAVGLQTGQAIVLHGEDVDVIEIREQYTFHAGFTPGMDAVTAPELQTIDADMLASLQKSLQAVQAQEIDAEKEALRAQVDELVRQVANLTSERGELESRLEKRDREIQQLKSQIEMLSQLRVQVEQVTPGAIGQMDVGEIQAGQIVAPANGTGPAEQLPTPPPQQATSQEPYRSPLATDRAINRQKRRFETLLSDIGRQPKHHQRILRYLVEREDQKLNPRELARFVGYSESTLRSAPPTWMRKEGLLSRSGKSGHHRYYSSARTALAQKFPDLDVDDLIGQLLDGIPK